MEGTGCGRGVEGGRLRWRMRCSPPLSLVSVHVLSWHRTAMILCRTKPNRVKQCPTTAKEIQLHNTKPNQTKPPLRISQNQPNRTRPDQTKTCCTPNPTKPNKKSKETVIHITTVMHDATSPLLVLLLLRLRLPLLPLILPRPPAPPPSADLYGRMISILRPPTPPPLLRPGLRISSASDRSSAPRSSSALA